MFGLDPVNGHNACKGGLVTAAELLANYQAISLEHVENYLTEWKIDDPQKGESPTDSSVTTP